MATARRYAFKATTPVREGSTDQPLGGTKHRPPAATRGSGFEEPHRATSRSASGLPEAFMSARLQPEQRQNRQPGREHEIAAAARARAQISRRRQAERSRRSITGGDSGNGRATAIAMAREGGTSRSSI